MALSITINKVNVAASFDAGATVATAVASGGTTYVYSLATGSDKFAINSSTGVVTVIAKMDASNIASFSVIATSETSTVTSGIVYPNIAAAIKTKFNTANMIYKITKDYDLNNCILTIPDGCTLDFQGGSFSNGEIEGNNTSVCSLPVLCFKDTITLKGTWYSILAYSEWFGLVGDCILDNNIFVSGTDNNKSISNLLLFNNIVIKKGTYYTTGHFKIKTGQSIDFSGSIIKWSFTNKYSSLLTFGEGTDNYELVSNVDIKNLTIIGNKQESSEVTEWASGISIRYAKNINIINVNTWYNRGDGINIGGTPKSDGTLLISENINIINMTSLYNHRQGCSITEVDRLQILNSEFSYTSGTAPQDGIDIEPNPVKIDNVIVKYQQCKNIVIKNCIFKSNAGNGISVVSFSDKDDNNSINNIYIEDCVLDNNNETGVAIRGVDGLFLKNLNINTPRNGIVFDNSWQYNIYCDNINIINKDITNKSVGLYIIPGSDASNLKNNININNLNIKGFGSYGFLAPSVPGREKSITHVNYSNITIENCYNSFFSGTCCDIVSYSNIRSENTGLNINGEKYEGWTFGWNVAKSDSTITRTDYNAIKTSGESGTKPLDISYTNIIWNNVPKPCTSLLWIGSASGSGGILESSPMLKQYKGETAERPSYLYSTAESGCYYYDTTLKQFILWNGNIWTDVYGLTASKMRGDSSERPTLLQSDYGKMYYDSTLKKIILWNGTTWTNLDGTALV